MKKLIYILAAFVAITAVGCKTNEANYRRAYEKAVGSRINEGSIDSLVAGDFYVDNGRPAIITLGDEKLDTRIEYVTLTKIEGEPAHAPMKRYNVVVGQFRQLFNARSLAARLEPLGYDLFIVQNQTPQYYVVAGSYDMAIDALHRLRQVQQETDVKLLPPCPWVLQSAQLVR